MSEHSSTVVESTKPLFGTDEVAQFSEDDAEAGRAIGRMLSVLFFYTVLAMLVSALVTYYWVTQTAS